MDEMSSSCIAMTISARKSKQAVDRLQRATALSGLDASVGEPPAGAVPAEQQKWWYEEIKANINSAAVQCRACCDIEKQRKAEVRRIYLEGLAKKKSG
jgi:hypothetical protein